MFPLNRAGWIFGAVGVLGLGFALGWSSATLFDSPPTISPGVTAPAIVGLPSVGSSKPLAVPVLSPEDSPALVRDFATDISPGSGGSFGDALHGALKINDYTDRMIRIREIVRGLSAEQLPGVLEGVKQLPRSERYQVLSELGRRWAEVDIQGALAAGLASGSANSDTFLSGVVSKWASTSPTEAAGWVTSLPPSGMRTNIVNAMITTIGQNDPRAAIQLLKSQGSVWQSGWVAENIFANWAGRDPQAAAAAVGELKGNSHLMAVRGVARAWAEDNPQAALAWGERMENAGTRKQVMGAVVEQWAESDPLALLAWSRTAQDDEIRRQAVSRGISFLALKDLPAALTEIGSLPAGDDRNRAVIGAADGLAQQDARGAVQLLSQLESGPERTQALSRICEVWANSEPQAAVEWLFENVPASKDSYQLRNVMGRWAERSPDEAISWAQKLPAGEKREAAIAGLAMSLSFQEPARAQNLFNQLSPDAQASVAGSISYSLAQQDPEKARAWAEALPPGKVQAAAFGTVAYQMAQKDVEETAHWLGTLPAGAGRDRAVANFSNFAARKDPEGAMAWALTISDERDRLQQVEQLYRNWKATDGPGAQKWIQTTNQISADQRRRMLER